MAKPYLPLQEWTKRITRFAYGKTKEAEAVRQRIINHIDWDYLFEIERQKYNIRQRRERLMDLGEGKVNKKVTSWDKAQTFAWHEVTDDLKRDLAIIGRMALSHEEVLDLPLPEDNTQLWPLGTLLRDDDGTMYEWRKG